MCASAHGLSRRVHGGPGVQTRQRPSPAVFRPVPSPVPSFPPTAHQPRDLWAETSVPYKARLPSASHLCGPQGCRINISPLCQSAPLPSVGFLLCLSFPSVGTSFDTPRAQRGHMLSCQYEDFPQPSLLSQFMVQDTPQNLRLLSPMVLGRAVRCNASACAQEHDRRPWT